MLQIATVLALLSLGISARPLTPQEMCALSTRMQEPERLAPINGLFALMGGTERLLPAASQEYLRATARDLVIAFPDKNPFEIVELVRIAGVNARQVSCDPNARARDYLRALLRKAPLGRGMEKKWLAEERAPTTLRISEEAHAFLAASVKEFSLPTREIFIHLLLFLPSHRRTPFAQDLFQVRLNHQNGSAPVERKTFGLLLTPAQTAQLDRLAAQSGLDRGAFSDELILLGKQVLAPPITD